MSAHFPPSLTFFVTDNGRLPKKTRKRGLINSLSHFFIRPHARVKRREREREREQTKMDISLIFSNMRPRVFCHATSEIIFRLDRSFFSSWFLHMCVVRTFHICLRKKETLLPFSFGDTHHHFFLHNNKHMATALPLFGSTQTRKDSKTYSSPSYYLSSPAREEKPFP